MEIILNGMKTLYKIITIGALALGLASCSNVAEFHTADYVTFASASYTVKEDAGEIKIPVNIHSDKTISTTVTYTIASGEGYAVPGTDYTLDGAGVLNISNEEGAVCDSIVIRPIPQIGVLQGNKSILITLGEVTDDGIYKGSTSECVVTILDTDGGLSLLVGTWTGTDITTSRNPGAVSWSIATVADDDEGLEDFPSANAKIQAGSTFTDAVGNEWEAQADIYAFYDESDNTFNIYPAQIFDAGNFGGDYGVLYVSFDVAATVNGTDTPVTFMVEDGTLTLSSNAYFVLWNSSGVYTANCGAFLAGAKIVKD